VLGGYIGKVLRVNLAEEKTTIQTFSEETLRKYIGGSGLGARILYDVFINDGEVEIRDAANLWGKDTYEVDEILKAELGAKVVTASIGQAGENLVKFAAIMNDGVEGRAAGRCGVGAVMGSKNLKAIAVMGNIQPHIVKEEEFKASVKEWAVKIKNSTNDALGQFGTSVGLVSVEALGNLPIKNFAQGRFEEGARKICGQAMAESILTKRYHCAQCVIGCGRTIHVKEGPFAGVEGGGPEYETLGMLGSNCLIDNIEAIAKGNELCNRYGLDTISTGSSISFAMECYEHGLISKDQLVGA